MVYKADIVKEYGISFEEAGRLLAGIDREGLRAKHTARYSWDLWDKETPVNGAAAETICARPDFPNDADAAAVFVYRDGTIVYFQYTNPRGSSPMTAADAQAFAEESIAMLAGQDTDAEIWSLVKQGMEDL